MRLITDEEEATSLYVMELGSLTVGLAVVPFPMGFFFFLPA